MYDLRIIHGNVYHAGAFSRKNLYIENGTIKEISQSFHEAKESYDARGAMVLPGFIDPHVHFALKVGNHVSADDFRSGSVTAAYGGVTTFVDFLDPTATVKDLETAFERRLEEAKESVIDYKLHATLKNPEDPLDEYIKKMRALGLDTLKVFTTYSDSNRRTYDEAIETLLSRTRKDNFLVLAHIENDDLITLDDAFTHEDLAKSRPSESETTEALKLAGMVEKTGGRLYMVHLSSGTTLSELIHHYETILNTSFFVETCPQYLTFTREALHGKDGHLYTFAPPLRTRYEQSLIEKHFDRVHTIGTDHAPFLSEEKEKPKLRDIPLGIGSVEHAFNILYQKFGNTVIDKMTLNPAKRMGLYPRKGTLEVGSDADIAIVEKTAPYPIKANHSNCDYSLYQGQEVSTKIKATLSRGRFVIKDGTLIEQKGQWLKGEGIHD
ncbi:MAG: dihydroorotase [Candidatus Izemoplasmataceae bacterium]